MRIFDFVEILEYVNFLFPLSMGEEESGNVIQINVVQQW